MKARCPVDENHKYFITVIHVAKGVIVDDNGEFVDSIEGTDEETLEHPRPENNWICSICGAQAEVES